MAGGSLVRVKSLTWDQARARSLYMRMMERPVNDRDAHADSTGPANSSVLVHRIPHLRPGRPYWKKARQNQEDRRYNGCDLEGFAPNDRNPGSTLTASLDRIVVHCLENDPADRFQSARDLAFALSGVNDS